MLNLLLLICLHANLSFACITCLFMGGYLSGTYTILVELCVKMCQCPLSVSPCTLLAIHCITRATSCQPDAACGGHVTSVQEAAVRIVPVCLSPGACGVTLCAFNFFLLGWALDRPSSARHKNAHK